MLSVSSEVMFRKNLEGSRTQGLGPPSNSISFEEPRVTKATEEGSTACWGMGGRKVSIHVHGRPCPATDDPVEVRQIATPPWNLVCSLTAPLWFVVKIQKHMSVFRRTVFPF